MKKISLLLTLAFLTFRVQAQNYWKITGTTEISFDLENQTETYTDNLEMSGRKASGIITYSIDTVRRVKISREIIFPQLHPYITETDEWWRVFRAYERGIYEDDFSPVLLIDSLKFAPGKLKAARIDGFLEFEFETSKSGLSLTRKFYPAAVDPVFFETWNLKNETDKPLTIQAGKLFRRRDNFSPDGTIIRTVVKNDFDAPEKFTLAPGDEFSFNLEFSAMTDDMFMGKKSVDYAAQRSDFLQKVSENLILETPNETLNTFFNFAKIRASESIFDSKLGLIHSPGGGRYYVGIWANDQAEYVSPFFPYLGYDLGNESAINCYRAFAKEINPEYKPMRYAFELEGIPPPFYLDRGDAAMIAYGAAQFVLTYGKEETTREFYPLIEWCLEYCRRQLNAAGVVKSESDEMEGRIETGDANLSTSALYYGALNLAADLTATLKMPQQQTETYRKQAEELAANIEKYFGATIEGLPTYKYYAEHDKLRHWICLPLVVGIDSRKDATVEALFDRLWTENGVHVEKNSDNPAISEIFWDRGTLYALRGTFLAGATEKSLEKLIEYSEKRLLGDRVPYAVEAYPEGNMAHLSAESGLYCRIFTEGMFGIVPTGLRSFELTPRLPAEWAEMNLRNIQAFGNSFDIEVTRHDGELFLKIKDSKNGKFIFNNSFKKGGTVKIELP